MVSTKNRKRKLFAELQTQMLEELELYKTALTFSDTEDIVETKAVCAEILQQMSVIECLRWIRLSV